MPDHRASEPTDLELEVLREDMLEMQAQWKQDLEREKLLKVSLQQEVTEFARNNDILVEKLENVRADVRDLQKRHVQLQEIRLSEANKLQTELMARNQKIEVRHTG